VPCEQERKITSTQ